MKGILRLAAADFKRLGRNTVTVIIMLGLVFLPSLFTWYNVLACWDVFDNTGNLTVAVANADEGYQSDLVPLRVNVGEQVVSALRANDQMKWEFTDEEDAIDGVKSGRYYAAVVIPPEFSRDMMTFYSVDAQHASLIYYSNEKKNAIAPKVTDQGADQISDQVNRVFAQTLSESALGIAQALADHVEDADAQGALADLAASVGDIGSRMQEAAQVVRAHAGLLDSARLLVEGSGGLLSQAQGLADDAASSTEGLAGTASSVSDAMDRASSALSDALKQSADGFASAQGSIGDAFDSASALSADSAAAMRAQAQQADAQAANYRELSQSLAASAGDMPAEAQPAVSALAQQMESAAQLLEQLRDALYAAAASVEAGDADAQAKRAEAEQLAQQAADALQQAQEGYDQDLRPLLEDLAGKASALAETLPSTAAALGEAGSDLSSGAQSVSERMRDAAGGLSAAADDLDATGSKLKDVSEGMLEALSTGDLESLRKIIGSDPSALAEALSAPVSLDRHAVYPVSNFGSAMAPLYTTLALWIGALLIMVAIKANPSDEERRELGDLTPRQVFAGRFAVVAALSLLQSTSIGLGNLFFLGVQAVHPLLYMACLWGSGLVFAFIIYTLVASFANFGKALSVFLLIIQVSGGGGSYPLQLLPQFVQDVSPYLPITHAVNAMRAAQFGVYQGDFWVQLGTLALFTLPFIVLGLVLRNPLIKLVGKFVEKVESTKVM